MENSHERGKDFGLEVNSDFLLNSLYRNDNSFVSPLSKDSVVYTMSIKSLKIFQTSCHKEFLFNPRHCFQPFPTGNQGCRAHWMGKNPL